MQADCILEILQSLFVSIPLGIASLKLWTKSKIAVFIFLNYTRKLIVFYARNLLFP